MSTIKQFIQFNSAAGAGASLAPNEISGLHCWYDSVDSTLGTDDPSLGLDTIGDLGSGFGTLTRAAGGFGLKLNASEFNSLQSFDTTNTLRGQKAGAGANLAAPFHLFMTFYSISGGASGGARGLLSGDFSEASQLHVYLNATDIVKVDRNFPGGTNIGSSSGAISEDTPHLIEIYATGSNLTMKIDGTTEINAVSESTVALQRTFTIGAFSGAGNTSSDFLFGTYVTYDNVLSESDASGLSNYLANRWGVSL